MIEWRMDEKTGLNPSEREARNHNRAIALLGLLCHDYDRGALDVARLMSNLLTQLIVSRGRNVALFEQVGWKVDNFPICVRVIDGPALEVLEVGTTLATLLIGITGAQGGASEPVALWIPDYRHFSEDQKFKIIMLSDWLKGGAITTPSGTLSRRELIDFVRDKDGGAHCDVDAKMGSAAHYLEAADYSPAARNSTIEFDGVVYDISSLPSVILPVLRQMSYELLSAIFSYTEYSDHFQPTCVVSVYNDDQFCYAMAPEGYPDVGKVNGQPVERVKPQENPTPRRV